MPRGFFIPLCAILLAPICARDFKNMFSMRAERSVNPFLSLRFGSSALGRIFPLAGPGFRTKPGFTNPVLSGSAVDNPPWAASSRPPGPVSV